VKDIAIIVAVALMLLVCANSSGCIAFDPKAKDYAERIKAHDAEIYGQSIDIAKTADRRAYADPTTRPYVPPAILDRHYQSIDEGREIQDNFTKFANPIK
jgi:hypothetical protein